MKYNAIICFIINILIANALTVIDSSRSKSKLKLNINKKGIKYAPKWDSLDKRPLPQWYDDAKIGIFLHWGVYSVPSYGTEWFWEYWKGLNSTDYVQFMEKNYRPGFTYQDFGRDFTAELFKPDEWADLFKDAGAKYVVLTSKHHDGYALWPSKYSFGWNSGDVGAHRDLIGDLATSIRSRTDIHFGLYHSMFEWFNQLWLEDKQSNFTTSTFVTNKAIPELKELIMEYQPDVIWSDGDWEAPDTYWTSTDFLAWLYNESPVKNTVVVNDRWGINTPCKHGDVWTCEDKYNPGVIQPHKWENAMTLDKGSWGYRKDAKLQDYLTSKELITVLVETISCGGNLLVNVGPSKEGTIDPIFEERLRDLGSWLNVTGEAVYATRPWDYQNDTLTPGVWFTKPSIDVEVNGYRTVYAFVLDWPLTNVLDISCVSPYMNDGSSVTLLGFDSRLEWAKNETKLSVLFPNKAFVTTDFAWVLKIDIVAKK